MKRKGLLSDELIDVDPALEAKLREMIAKEHGALRGEIRKAIQADKDQLKFPPLKRIGELIRNRSLFDVLPDEDLAELADFLEGKRRRPAHRPRGEDELIDRLFLFYEYRKEAGGTARGGKSAALERLASEKELSDTKTLWRSLQAGAGLLAERLTDELRKDPEGGAYLAKVKKLLPPGGEN